MATKEQARTIVFVLGAPGAGKGTQCAKIVQRYGWAHLSTGDLLRAEVAAGSELGLEAQALMKAGEMVPTRLVLDLLVNAMSNSGATRFLVDGFPRKLDQLQEFEEKIQPADLVLAFMLDEDAAVSRLVKRGETSGRADDNEDTIRSRMQVFWEESQPVIDALKETGRVAEIDASADVEEVFQMVAPVMDMMHDKASEKETAAVNTSIERATDDAPAADNAPATNDGHAADDTPAAGHDAGGPQEDTTPDATAEVDAQDTAEVDAQLTAEGDAPAEDDAPAEGDAQAAVEEQTTDIGEAELPKAETGGTETQQGEELAEADAGQLLAGADEEPVAQSDESEQPVLQQGEGEEPLLDTRVNAQVTDLVEPHASQLVNAQITDAVNTAVNSQITDAVNTAVNSQITDAVKTAQTVDTDHPGHGAHMLAAFPTAVNGQITGAVATAVNGQITDALATPVNGQITDALTTAVNAQITDAVETSVNDQITDAEETSVNDQVTDAVADTGPLDDDSAAAAEGAVQIHSLEHAEQPTAVPDVMDSEFKGDGPALQDVQAASDESDSHTAAAAKLELPEASKVVFVLGAPGAGKGTQCARIVADYGWKHLSTGDLLRAEVAAGTPLGQEAEGIMREGGFLPTSVILGLLVNAMSASNATRFLVDGFPRKLDQLLEFEEKVRPADLVLAFTLDEDAAVLRLVKRGETSGRADDNEDTIRSRMQVFWEESQPVIDALKETGRVAEIDASADVDEVYAHVQRAIAQLEGLPLPAEQQEPGLQQEEACNEPIEDSEGRLPLKEDQSALPMEEDNQGSAQPEVDPSADGQASDAATKQQEQQPEARSRPRTAEAPPEGVMTVCSPIMDESSQRLASQSESMRLSQASRRTSSNSRQQQGPSSMARWSSLEPVQEPVSNDAAVNSSKPPTPPAAPPPGSDAASIPPRSPLASRGMHPAADVTSFKQAATTAKNLPVRQYMDATVVPILREALRALNDTRPSDPLQFLADQLMAARGRGGNKAAGAL